MSPAPPTPTSALAGVADAEPGVPPPPPPSRGGSPSPRGPKRGAATHQGLRTSEPDVTQPGRPTAARLALRITPAEGDESVGRVGDAPSTLEAGTNTIGGDRLCSVRLRGAGVRPLHCVITIGPQGAVAHRWAGATLLNGQPFAASPLAVGDRLQVASVEMVVVALPGSPEPPGGSLCGPSTAVLRARRATAVHASLGVARTRTIDPSDPDRRRVRVLVRALRKERIRRREAAEQAAEQQRRAERLAESLTAAESAWDNHRELREALASVRLELAASDAARGHAEAEAKRLADLRDTSDALRADRDEALQAAQAAEARLDKTQTELTDCRCELDDRLTDLEQLSKQLVDRQAELDRLDAEVSRLETHVEALQTARAPRACDAGGDGTDGQRGQDADTADASAPPPAAEATTAESWLASFAEGIGGDESGVGARPQAERDQPPTEPGSGPPPGDGATADASPADAAGGAPDAERRDADRADLTGEIDGLLRAEQPATAAPESFLEKHAGLLAADADNASHTDAQPPAAATAPTPDRPPESGGSVAIGSSAEGADVDGSVEDYMAELMQRIRGGVQCEPPLVSLGVTADAGRASDARRSVEASPDPFSVAMAPTPPVPADAITDLGELRRGPAPEHAHDMSALRELANSSARSAIGEAEKRKNRKQATANLMIAGLALACAAYLGATAPALASLQIVGGLAGFGWAAFWVVQTLRHTAAAGKSAAVSRVDLDAA